MLCSWYSLGSEEESVDEVSEMSIANQDLPLKRKTSKRAHMFRLSQRK